MDVLSSLHITEVTQLPTLPSHSSVTFKMGQGHQKRFEQEKLCRGKDHAEFETSCLNSVFRVNANAPLASLPMGSHSRGGDAAVNVFDINHPSLPTPFYSVIVSVSVSFNCILFHKFSQQLSVFSLCSAGLISAFLVLSTIYLFMKSLPQP